MPCRHVGVLWLYLRHLLKHGRNQLLDVPARLLLPLNSELRLLDVRDGDLLGIGRQRLL